MFEFIKGTIASKLPGTVVIEAAGIGYRINAPLSTTSKLGDVGDPARLLLHHVIKPDQGEEKLFGFIDEMERALFLSLTSVKGIGPSKALQILCHDEPRVLIGLVATADVVALTKIKGIGKKGADLIVAELRDQFSKWHIEAASPSTRANAVAESSARQDAIDALLALGYRKAQSEKSVDKALKSIPEATVEALVRAALQQI